MKIIAKLTARSAPKGLSLSELSKRAQQAKSGTVKAGILGAGGEAGGGPTALQIAVYNEFGTKDGVVPARPFMRSTYNRMQQAWREMLKKLIKRSLREPNMTTERALGLVGVQMVADIRATITDGEGVPPPNAPSTIERKGSDRPLVDTGRMLGAITHEVDVK